MRSLIIVAAVACLVAVSSVTFAQSTRQKRLIEFGWDEPDTAFMRKHITEMEKTPFDGTVFHLNFKADDGSMQNYVWHTWSTRRFEESDFQHAIDDLKNTPLKKFSHNFLRFNTTPANVDWFDDSAFAAIAHNARLAARIARNGKAAGILFDIEQYNEQLFNYAKQRDAQTKSFDDYAAKARQRGREVMTAFQQGFPDLHIILTFGHTLAHMQAGGDKAKLAQIDYGLAAPFLDGLFDAASGNAKIVDGFEISYGYKEPKQFDEVPVTIANSVIKMVGDPAKFRRHSSLGFGLWMDYDWRNRAWDEKDFSRNHFSPEQFETSVRKALSVADDYVWIYTETPKWWTANSGKPEKLPAAYDQAVRRARGK
jgi:hypothetical protein